MALRMVMQRFLVVGLMLCCCGCGKGDSVQRGAVSGRVTLDGIDITAGTITFYPSGDTKGPVVGGPITNGRYAIRIERGPAVGSNRVVIEASKKTGRKIQIPRAEPGAMTDEVVSIIPERYNARSTLEAKVKPGKAVLDFNLTTK